MKMSYTICVCVLIGKNAVKTCIHPERIEKIIMLEVKNISFEVAQNDGTTAIIKDLSFTIPKGRLTVITGPNGGGKSTLAKLIMGLEKVTSGSITFNGTDVTDMGITERAKLGIGYAFQQPPRFKGMKVSKLLNLAHGSELNDEQCCGYLSKVGLCARDYIDREIDRTLSGGELKRIEIATLLAKNPQLAIYDEPEAGIDLWSFAMLVNTFDKLRADGEQTVMIISHQERILQLADDIMILQDGGIRAYGPKEEIFPTLNSMNMASHSCMPMEGDNC